MAVPFDFASQYIDPEKNNMVFSGLYDVPDFSFYKSKFKEYTIRPEQQFRPDKIAWELWDAPDLHWVLDIINDFSDGFMEYTINRKIYYVEDYILEQEGLL